jgi:septal ring factor EnvC (AmiA/AmiB activator)
MKRSGKLVCGVALSCGLAVTAAAEIRVAPPAGTLSDRYQHAERALNEARNNAASLLAERDRLESEQLELSQKLVANAARVQELEQATEQSGTELGRLAAETSRSQEELARDRQSLSQVLAMIQRLRLEETSGQWNGAGRALQARRAELQAGGALRILYSAASQLDNRLNKLANAEHDALDKNADKLHEQQELVQVRADMDRLIEEKRTRQASLSGAVEDVQKVVDQIGQEADGLKSLMDRIAALRASTVAADQPRIRTVGPANGAAAALARGSLHPPVPGKPIPGDPAGPGVTPGAAGPTGLWFEVSGRTEAIAPADSEVVFAGRYQKLGQVLILELAGGYDLALAGLGRIDVHVGDVLLAGEPVGTLPEGKAAPLYLELRRNGKVVDPAPWISADIGKAKGT